MKGREKDTEIDKEEQGGKEEYVYKRKERVDRLVIFHDKWSIITNCSLWWEGNKKRGSRCHAA